MTPRRRVGLWIVMAAFGAGGASALGGDSPAEAELTRKGLTRAGRVFFDAEAEKPALARIQETRTAYAAYAKAAEKLTTAEQIPMMVAELDGQRQALQANIQALNQQISAQTSNMGRYGRMMRSQTTPLKAEQQQMTASMNQIAAQEKALKAKAPSAKDKAALDADARQKGEAFRVALAELRTVVDEVNKKYADRNADAATKKALVELEKTGHAQLTLGPSAPFAAEMKELDHAERQFLGKKASAHAPKKKAEAKEKAKK